MRSEGEIRCVSVLAPGDLDHHGGVVDVAVADLDAEFHVAPTAPAARPHQDELPLWKPLIQLADQVPDLEHLVECRKTVVAGRVDIHHILDAVQNGRGDMPGRRKQPVFVKNIVRHLDRNVSVRLALRATLEQIQGMLVLPGGEFDIDRPAEGLFQNPEYVLDLLKERRVPKEIFERENRCSGLEIRQVADRRVQLPFFIHRDQVGEHRDFRTEITHDLFEADGLEPARLEVQHIDAFLRIA
ncbi:MAG: hypothetical protein BWY66_01516 [bacterium ADurb.Bin374]|nr:MAG: hypothetical protein BWY66_01516 [bacterium ADurb.Bin374]